MDDIQKVFEKINRDLVEEHKGEIVAIDPESGKYFTGKTETEAYRKASKQLPNRKFVFKRVGFSSTHFVGAL